jgi:hypothetical protein
MFIYLFRGKGRRRDVNRSSFEENRREENPKRRTGTEEVR